LITELSFKAQVPVIDANIGVGHDFNRPAPFETPEELLAEMQRHGVERALIHHQHGVTLSAVTGNELLGEWLENHEDVFFPQWMAGPESDSLKQFIILDITNLFGFHRYESTTLHNPRRLLSALVC